MQSDSDSDWDQEDLTDEDTGTVPCPACGKDVYEDADQCPVCGEFIVPASSASPLRGRPGLWVFFGIAGVIAVIVYLLSAWNWV